MPYHCNKYPVGVMRVDQNDADLLAVPQAKMLPGAAGVSRLVDSVTDGKIGTAQPLTAAHINNVGIGGCHRQRAHRACRLVVENRIPGAAEVGTLPYAAIVR